ncbi:MAG: precorrin-2 dehydrogenase/sirohydrochlorin ferrochelatase family protein [Thermodesulfobacteriota bacterium]
MPYYPIFVDLREQNVLVVGGGEVAERKVKNLLLHSCRIYIASLQLSSYLKELVQGGDILLVDPGHLDDLLKNMFMVITATNDSEFNSRVAAKAKACGKLVNSVDQPLDCTFIMPSIVKAGDLQIAISTGGKSPALAKKIRGELEGIFGREYGLLLELLGLVRRELLSQERPSSENTIIFQQLVDSPLLELIKQENIEGIKRTLSSVVPREFPVDVIVHRVFSGT